jgi:hypothetical protein
LSLIPCGVEHDTGQPTVIYGIRNGQQIKHETKALDTHPGTGEDYELRPDDRPAILAKLQNMNAEVEDCELCPDNRPAILTRLQNMNAEQQDEERDNRLLMSHWNYQHIHPSTTTKGDKSSMGMP